MPTKIRDTDILFNDGTTQSTAGFAIPAFGGVGAYIVAAKLDSGSNTNGGETIAGSNLRIPCVGAASANTVTPMNFGSNSLFNPGLSGTWRAMTPTGNANNIFADTAYKVTTLWMRIS